MEFQLHDAVKGANGLPQADLIKLADEQCDNLILGQTLTSSKGDGGAYALGKVHAGIRKEVIEDAGQAVANILNSQLIPAIIHLNYGHIPSRLPQFVPSIRGIDAEALETVAKAAEIMDVGEESARTIVKIPKPRSGEPVLRKARLSVPLRANTGMPLKPLPPREKTSSARPGRRVGAGRGKGRRRNFTGVGRAMR